MRTLILMIGLACLPTMAMAQSYFDNPAFGNTYYGNEGEPKSNIERSVREYERQEIAQQAQRDFWYQLEQAEREEAMLKELREINDNQRRMMGETVYPRFP